MPSGMAAEMRAALPTMDRSGVVLQRSAESKTGFVNVIEVKGKFQARLQVPGDGLGGSKKRKQVPLPGIFDTAEDAAFHLASFKKGMQEAGLCCSFIQSPHAGHAVRPLGLAGFPMPNGGSHLASSRSVQQPSAWTCGRGVA